MNTLGYYLSLAGRGFGNYFTSRPFCVSFEITYACNANCKHCHLGGPIPNEKRAGPEEYAARCREIKPVVAQVSGGEPLLRKDLEEIISALKRKNKAPYIVLTTNGALLTPEKYLRLRDAGVDSFSLSFDFPDERHDEFRGIPGLFKKIIKLLETVKDEDSSGIALSGVVQRENFRDLLNMAEFARKWNVKMNFSTYTWLRTENTDFMIPENEIPELKNMIAKLKEHKYKYGTIVASDFVFDKMVEFFRKKTIGGCRAGERFLVVNPDATLSPCGLIIRNYTSRKELMKDFIPTNSCGNCYTSIRANTEKPVRYLIKDSLRAR
jgi:MoaA/NifB/PqqE/SkfB family radical SAM enzyme